MRKCLGVLCLLLTATGASAQSLEQQAVCAKQAKVALQDWENDAKETSPNLDQHNEYQSHYNTKLNKCFMVIETMTFGKSIIHTDTLIDAFEQRVYAQFTWSFAHEPDCELIPTPQTQTHCSSKNEWDAFVAKYMEE